MDLREANNVPGLFRVKDHWYYAAKYAFVRKLIGNTRHKLLLDVGAGSGLFGRAALDDRIAGKVVSVDLAYREGVPDCASGDDMICLPSIEFTEADLALMLDVIEHVQDDVSFLKEYRNKITPGCTVIVSVPAFNCLWSEHDKVLGHFRRYTIKSLEATLTAAGYQIEKTCYFFGAIFPAVFVLRSFDRLFRCFGGAPRETSDLKEHGRFLNWFLEKVCLAELRMSQKNRYLGLTVFAVCKI